MNKYFLSSSDLVNTNFVVFLLNIVMVTVSLLFSYKKSKVIFQVKKTKSLVNQLKFNILFYLVIVLAYGVLLFILMTGLYDSTTFSLSTLLFMIPMSLLNYKVIINQDRNSLLNFQFIIALVPLFFTSNRIVLVALVLNYLIFNYKDTAIKIKAAFRTIIITLFLYSLYFIVVKSYIRNDLNIFEDKDRSIIYEGLWKSVFDGIYPMLESFAVILKNMPDHFSYHYGQGYINILLMPIPDSVIQGPELLSYWFNHYFNSTQYYIGGTGQLPGLLGELYMSGGYINLFIFMILLTIFYEVLFKNLMKFSTQLNKYIYISLLTLLLIVFRDGFSTAYIHIYIFIIILPIILLRRS